MFRRMRVSTRNLWVLVTRSKELPDQWVAHCLDLDVVTQGNSIEHAFEMSVEAVQMLIDDDIEHGLNPFTRSPAPEEEWAPLHSLIQNCVPLDAVPPDQRSQLWTVAAQLQVSVLERSKSAPKLEPPPWRMASFEKMNRDSQHAC